MNAPVPIGDMVRVEALQAELGCLRAENARLSRARSFWRRFTLALIAIWATLAALSFAAGPSPSPCLRGRLQPAYSRPIPPGVRGAPWPVHA